MSKKKKKKHKKIKKRTFKYIPSSNKENTTKKSSNPSASKIEDSSLESSKISPKKEKSNIAQADKSDKIETSQKDYVKKDIKKTIAISLMIFALMGILYWVLNYTNLGIKIYELIKI